MLGSGQLNVNDRVLLHLSRFASDVPPEEYPPETTQAGIASAVGISRTHVPRAVRGLMKDGLVAELTARVKGHERRMNVYAITGEGFKRADEFWSIALDTAFSVLRDGSPVNMTGRELDGLVGKRKAIAAISQMTDGIVVLSGTGRTPVRDLADAPEADVFVGREQELGIMEAFTDSDRSILVVLGNRGYGTTALVRKYVDQQATRDVLWISLIKDTTATAITERILGFARRLQKETVDLPDALGIETAIYVFDHYFNTSEEVVELFSSMADIIDGAKLVITARQETPAYNWFYHKKQVDSGVVEELKLKGLDQESATKLLGKDRIEPEALRRILMMTRSQPMTLKMLRDGDLEGLKRDTVFTPEEARYLLFLMDRTI